MNHQEGASPISSGTGSATSQPSDEQPLAPEPLGQLAGGEVGERLGGAEGDDEGEDRGGRGQPEVLLADERQHAPLQADHRRRRARSAPTSRPNWPAFARRPSRTGTSCRAAPDLAGAVRGDDPLLLGRPRRHVRERARRRTRPGRRARAAGCGRARSRSRRSGCRRGRGRRPSRRSGSDRGRRGRAARAAARRLACSSRACPRASPATCRSGRPTSPIRSESPLKTSHGSSRAAAAVGDGVGVMGGRVTRRRDRGHDRVAELDHVTVGERDVLELDAGAGGEVGGRAGALDERGQAGDVVGLDVRLEDGDDRRAERRGGREVVVDEVGVRIDDGQLGVACRSRTGSSRTSRRRSGRVEAASRLLSARSRPAGRRAATRESRRRVGAPSSRASRSRRTASSA